MAAERLDRSALSDLLNLATPAAPDDTTPKSLESERATERHGSSARMHEAQRALGEAHQQIEHLQADLAAQTALCDELETKGAASTESARARERECDDLREQLRSSKRSVSQLERRVAQLEALLAEERKRATVAEEKVAELEARLAASESEAQRAQTRWDKERAAMLSTISARDVEQARREALKDRILASAADAQELEDSVFFWQARKLRWHSSAAAAPDAPQTRSCICPNPPSPPAPPRPAPSPPAGDILTRRAQVAQWELYDRAPVSRRLPLAHDRAREEPPTPLTPLHPVPPPTPPVPPRPSAASHAGDEDDDEAEDDYDDDDDVGSPPPPPSATHKPLHPPAMPPAMPPAAPPKAASRLQKPHTTPPPVAKKSAPRAKPKPKPSGGTGEGHKRREAALTLQRMARGRIARQKASALHEKRGFGSSAPRFFAS